MDTIMTLDVIRAEIERAYPKQIFIPVAGFCCLIAMSYGVGRNKISSGTFPVRIVKRGRRNFVLASDVVDYMCKTIGVEAAESAETTGPQGEAIPVPMAVLPTTEKEKGSPGPGRPRNMPVEEVAKRKKQVQRRRANKRAAAEVAAVVGKEV